MEKKETLLNTYIQHKHRVKANTESTGSANCVEISQKTQR